MAQGGGSDTTIVTAVRIRPLIDRELKDNLGIHWKEEKAASSWYVRQCDPKTKKPLPPQPGAPDFCYDRVFGMKSSTQEIFDHVAKPMVADFFTGFNGTIVAYGQTSSGKTHTMSGDSGEPGIIPLTIHKIFEEIHASVNKQFIMSISYVEIYEDRVRDLLCESSKGDPQGYNPNDLAVREDEEGKTFIENVELVQVTDQEQIYAKKEEGERRRHFGATAMNTRSSRSHTIFTLIMESQDIGNEEHGAVKRSIMNLVDLAGSERPGAVDMNT